MILLDTTVLVYAVGFKHPLRDPCRALIEAIDLSQLQSESDTATSSGCPPAMRNASTVVHATYLGYLESTYPSARTPRRWPRTPSRIAPMNESDSWAPLVTCANAACRASSSILRLRRR